MTFCRSFTPDHLPPHRLWLIDRSSANSWNDQKPSRYYWANLSAASRAESNTSSLHGLMSQKAPTQSKRSKHEYRTCRFCDEQQFTIAQTHPERPSSCCGTGAAAAGARGVVVVVVRATKGGGSRAGARVGFMICGRLVRCASGWAMVFVLPECAENLIRNSSNWNVQQRIYFRCSACAWWWVSFLKFSCFLLFPCDSSLIRLIV